MSIFKGVAENALLLNRLDPNEMLGTCSDYGFELEGLYWPTVEHYYQAMKYDGALHEKIRTSADPHKARKIGKGIFRKKRNDWQQIRPVVMTRGVYIRCRTHQIVADALLETGDTPIADNCFGEYYWGVGRDGRGENNYGKILENVRTRLRTGSSSSDQTSELSA